MAILQSDGVNHTSDLKLRRNGTEIGSISSGGLTVTGNIVCSGFLSSKNCAFHAEASATTALSAATQTKVTFGSVSLDSNSNYNSSLSRFTPTVAGWYFLRSVVRADITNNIVLHLYFFKNGTTDFGIGNFISVSNSQCATDGTVVGFFNGTTDYAEVRVFCGVAGNTSGTGINATFSGFLISPSL